MSSGDGGEVGFYATAKVAGRTWPALKSSSILGICALPLPGVISTMGGVKLGPEPQVRVAEEGILVSIVLF